MSHASNSFRELAASSDDELESLLRNGRRPSVESLLGYEYRGFNHPRRSALLGIRKFIKGFFPAGGDAFGFNTRTKQNGLEGEWIARPDNANPGRFAFFRVATREPRDDLYPHALLIDYSQGNNRAYDPAGLVRDYLVRVDPDSDDLLLGKAYLAVGSARIAVGFFLLERHRPFEPEPALERRALG